MNENPVHDYSALDALTLQRMRKSIVDRYLPAPSALSLTPESARRMSDADASELIAITIALRGRDALRVAQKATKRAKTLTFEELIPPEATP